MIKVSLDEEFCGKGNEKAPWKIKVSEFESFKGKFIFHYQFDGLFSLTYQEDFSCFISSEDYKAQNVHSLLEKEDFSFDFIINLDANLYERRDECYITIPEDFFQELALHEEHQRYEEQTLDFSSQPKWFSA